MINKYSKSLSNIQSRLNIVSRPSCEGEGRGDSEIHVLFAFKFVVEEVWT